MYVFSPLEKLKDQGFTMIINIAASTETQATSAHQVNLAMRSVSETTESNAAAAEQMAASADEEAVGDVVVESTAHQTDAHAPPVDDGFDRLAAPEVR